MLTPSRNLLRISCRSCVSSVPLSDKAEGDEVRRAIIFTYCPSVIASSYGDDDLYDLLFGQTKEGCWGKYLLRRPHRIKETYSRPDQSNDRSRPQR